MLCAPLDHGILYRSMAEIEGLVTGSPVPWLVRFCNTYPVVWYKIVPQEDFSIVTRPFNDSPISH